MARDGTLGTGRRALVIGVGVIVVAGLVLALPTMWTRVMARGRIVAEADVPRHDVGVIFGAEMYATGEPSPYLKARLDLGVVLVNEGKVAVLIVSGDNTAEHHHETTNMRRYLERQGVASAAIVEDEHGLDTYDTCVRTREVFGVTSAVLVSQSYHLPRAIATCRAVGVDAVGVGDTSVKETSRRWNEFSRREIGANLKMVVDLVSRREPSLDGPRDAVTEALGG